MKKRYSLEPLTREEGLALLELFVTSAELPFPPALQSAIDKLADAEKAMQDAAREPAVRRVS